MMIDSCVGLVVIVFFFKQKTAYEMRISDWSSDVCSSDLPAGVVPRGRSDRHPRAAGLFGATEGLFAATRAGVGPRHRMTSMAGQWPAICFCRSGGSRELLLPPLRRQGRRSEEHTSELQSLMRISYAVFCLKKKNRKQR